MSPLLEQMKRRLVAQQTFQQAIATILKDCMALTGAEYGNVQLAANDDLLIVDQRGFKLPFLTAFRKVTRHDGSACGRALRSGKTVAIEDTELDAEFAPFRAVARSAGFRAVVTTPLLTRENAFVGLVSTHFVRVHRPTNLEVEAFERYSVLAGDYAHTLLTRDTLAAIAVKMNDQLYAKISDVPPENCPVWI